MKYNAVVEKGKDGRFSVYVDGIKGHGLYGSGLTVLEAKADMMSALNDMVEMYKADGELVPKALLNPTFVYRYDIASIFDYFDWINVSSIARKSGINESLMRQYKSGLAFASEKQCEKIQKTLNELAKELCEATI